MPIRVRYKNDPGQECTVRPTPLVNIGTQILKNGAGEAFGVTYSITLTGTLLADQGTPYAIEHGGITALRHPSTDKYAFHETAPSAFTGPYGAFDSVLSHTGLNRPPKQQIEPNLAATALITKQRALRALFAQDGQRVEITDFNYDNPAVICYPRLVDIQFSEGIWVDKCDFTITLEADTLLHGDKVDNEGTFIIPNNGETQENTTEAVLLGSLSGAFINDYSEDWSIEVDESTGESPDLPFSYRITHSLNATGKTHHTPGEERLVAWEQARKFVTDRLSDNVTEYPNIMGQIGSGTINLVDSFGGFSHVRNESIGQSAGTYTVTETWLLASGTAYENYSSSVSSDTSSAFVGVNIDGSIKGLSQISPSGHGSEDKPSAFDNAMSKYIAVSNSGQFGLISDIYKRANNLVAVELNSQPLSISVGTNDYLGEITYSTQFDNRPSNIISGVLTESISVNDTYPGDVFAIIPVLGRKTGPVLQYIGGRTEYTRDLSINLLMDYTKIPYGSGRNTLLLKKPSVIEPSATQIGNLIKELSPQNEPGIRKYFVNPPSESWEPKTGSYSFNLTWTYELNK
tara:strand:- start:1999 stop:3717 length:1719 start_codon:yes stop_codon:yes gene_type:complete